MPIFSNCVEETAQSRLRQLLEQISDLLEPTRHRPILATSQRLGVIRQLLLHEARQLLDASSADVPQVLERLSRREWQVLVDLLSGHSTKQISGDLDLCKQSIAKYRAKLFQEFHVTNAVDLTSLMWAACTVARASRDSELGSGAEAHPPATR